MVFALAVLARGGAAVARYGLLADDPDAYFQLGGNLARTGTLGWTTPTAYRAPLYPILIAACASSGLDARIALAFVQFALGVATCLLVYALALRFELGRAALLAPLLVAAPSRQSARC